MLHDFIVNLIESWLKMRDKYSQIYKGVTLVLVMFPTTDLCQLAFSNLVAIKTKARNVLIDVESSCDAR